MQHGRVGCAKTVWFLELSWPAAGLLREFVGAQDYLLLNVRHATPRIDPFVKFEEFSSYDWLYEVQLMMIGRNLKTCFVSEAKRQSK